LAARDRRIRLAVGDVGAESAVAELDRLLAHWVDAELLHRCGGGTAAELLRLGVDPQRLFERDVEEPGLGVEAPGVAALLEIRAVAAVLRGDLFTGFRVDA